MSQLTPLAEREPKPRDGKGKKTARNAGANNPRSLFDQRTRIPARNNRVWFKAPGFRREAPSCKPEAVKIYREMNGSSPRKLIIAIDGPAGAGKSTIASRLARKLGYVNLESGAMYRALALKAIENDVSFDDEAALDQLAQKSKIRIEPALRGNRVLLDGREVTERVREEDVSQGASRVSVHPRVRAWMVERQRELGASGGVVMEGRDIGTKVFPDADVKIFLDADPVIREQRRIQQQSSRGASAEAMAAELRERDRRDRTRPNSPLVAARDATIIDSTSMSEDEVLERIEALVQKKMAAGR